MTRNHAMESNPHRLQLIQRHHTLDIAAIDGLEEERANFLWLHRAHHRANFTPVRLA